MACRLPALREAFSQAFTRMGFVKAWGLLADEQAALHDKGMDAVDIADSYVLRGDKPKPSIGWKKPTKSIIPICPISAASRGAIPPFRTAVPSLAPRMGIPVKNE